MVPPIFPKRPRYPEFQRASKLARQVLQTACHEDFGNDEMSLQSQGCSCLKLTPLPPDFNSFADSVVLGLVCRLSSPESRFC